MKTMTEKELCLVNAMAENFYKVVPLEFRTYCALTSQISVAVLRHFGIAAGLLPCQVWYVTPQENFVVGFLGPSSIPGKWNGHVVCSGSNFLIDAALYQFKVGFDLTAPFIGVSQKFHVASQVISRLDLDEHNRVWWHLPPVSPEIDLKIPQEPPELIIKYAGSLIECLLAIGIPVPKSSSSGRTQLNMR